MKRLLLLLAVLLLAPAAWAQQQRLVTSSSPNDGATNVDLTTTVSFTFNGPVTLDAADELVTGLPEFAVDITATELSADGRTLTFTVEHREDTDYYWIVGGTSTDETGGTIEVAVPYLLYYTTAETAGSLTVSGTLVAASPDVESTAGVVILYDRNVFDADTSPDSARVAGIGLAVEGGAFTVRRVRPGTVYLYATSALTAEPDFDGGFGFDFLLDLTVGFYDADDDGDPDPLVVAGDVSGLSIPLYTFGAFAQTYTEARVAADALAIDGDLVDVGGFAVSEEGRAVFWTFTYYEAGADSATTVSILPIIGGEIERVEVDPFFDDFTPLPETIVGSDVALAVAEANGGADFRAEFPNATVFAVAGSSARSELVDTEYVGTEAWLVTYAHIDFSTFETELLSVIVDAATGAFIDTIRESEGGGIAVTLSTFIDGARAFVEGVGDDFQLIAVEATEVNEEGAASEWTFRFYSESQDALVVYTIGVTTTPSFEVIQNPELADTRALPETFVDSDAALAAALGAGGAAFLATHADVVIDVTAGYFPEAYPTFADTPLYVVTLVEDSGDEPEQFIALINVETGVVVDTRTDVSTEPDEALPAAVTLEANYPNPFNPSTVIPFTLERPGTVRLSVYDALGREVARLVDGVRPAGAHEAAWDADGQPSGVYLYRLEAGGTTLTRSMLLVK